MPAPRASHVTRALQAVQPRVRREHQIRAVLHTLARLEAAARARGAQ
ncbi:hypothetical protein [Deinococcus radiotolerans]|uniref:Uncharacterized protein n=1 Tax=Deinococcus radiotolerans TaxID=1309407 RepID=A0ABQ2FQ40_9DEIO|nr:hypothetical protein [Deinococcus radiotolerans]GGL15705.1 hypothetical protein GCM10010844_38310 [Deinococcus radiotolerans]